MALYELSDEQFDILLAAYPNAALYLAGRKVEPDIEAMATVMNVDGWTCDGHEPGRWCEDCKRLQLATTRKMWRAGIGGDE